jgi:hypothetical protein
MCNGFGMIVTSELKGYFVEPNNDGDVSHSEILKRLDWKDNDNQFTRRFVRVECWDWTMGSFRFDEDDTLPGWAEEHRDEIISLVDKTLAATVPAWAEYRKVRAPARAEYEKVCDAARAEYEKVRAAAWAEYEKACDAARAKFTHALSTIHGYVAKK